MSLGTFIWIMVGAYVLIAVVAFIVNINIGPVTPGLALLRAILWPFWVAGMIPGQRLPMD